MKKVAAIIQARMGSTRLPGKVLMDIAGKPMLEHIVERLKLVKNIDEIVVAAGKLGYQKIAFTDHSQALLDAYGMTRISGAAIKNIIKPLGSGGSADPLDQRQTSGWKATFVAKILNQDFMLRLEHGVSS